MRFFIVIISILFLSSPLYSQEQELHSQYLHLDSATSAGSGTHIGNGFVITAAHVPLAMGGLKDITKGKKKPKSPQLENMKMENMKMVWESDGAIGEAVPVYIDEDNDIALLKITGYEQLKSSRIACDADPKVHDVLTTSSFPTNLGRVEDEGRVIGPVVLRDGWRYKTFLMAMNMIPGQSGGALVNKDGNIVGMINAFPMFTSTMGAPSLGIAIPGSAICKSLLKFSEQQ
ncbi:MAG TPA: serine protease [Methylomirabilota bacterium]|nr:serine protease [Methylomirabilota bacterium]